MPKDAQGKETGWISKHALQEGALAADDMGRKAMADGYIIPRMLDGDIKAKLNLIDRLEERVKALEPVEEEPSPAPPAEEPPEPAPGA